MADMSDPNIDRLSDHEYDGIREYDNPLPGWWVMLFWATIIFSVIYLIWYHVGIHGESVAKSYEAAVQQVAQKQNAAFGDLKPDAATLVSLMADAKAMERGASVYKAYCLACHGPEGQGLVGPNMTDDHYKNVKSIEEFVTVITNGAGNGTMPQWGTTLSKSDIIVVASYTAAMRGKNLTGPRPAEGEIIAPWPGK
jgi:cytochrome c oxidase cbb3-type subunit 3